MVGVRADQSLKIDRRTYQVNQTPHSQQKNAIQLLRGLPAVTISADDQINLLGLAPLRHKLAAPLVQELYDEHPPLEFKLKLLKTFGKP